MFLLVKHAHKAPSKFDPNASVVMVSKAQLLIHCVLHTLGLPVKAQSIQPCVTPWFIKRQGEQASATLACTLGVTWSARLCPTTSVSHRAKESQVTF